jgi:hypothetical protein
MFHLNDDTCECWLWSVRCERREILDDLTPFRFAGMMNVQLSEVSLYQDATFITIDRNGNGIYAPRGVLMVEESFVDFLYLIS